jgi:hypothetical protein
MTHTIPLRHPLDDSGLPRRYSTDIPTPPVKADPTRYHHPHFVKIEPGASEGQLRYHFRRFTGYERKPEMPEAAVKDRALSWDQYCALAQQYEAAQVVWSKARLRRVAGPLLRKAAPLWETWTAARKELRETFHQFRQTEDCRWRAHLLRLTDAERAARAAAQAWDELAEQLARVAADQVDVAGWDEALDLDEVAREIGLDPSGWLIAHIDDYAPPAWGHRETPLVESLNREITTQRDRLSEVEHLAGDHDEGRQQFA